MGSEVLAGKDSLNNLLVKMQLLTQEVDRSLRFNIGTHKTAGMQYPAGLRSKRQRYCPSNHPKAHYQPAIASGHPAQVVEHFRTFLKCLPHWIHEIFLRDKVRLPNITHRQSILCT